MEQAIGAGLSQVDVPLYDDIHFDMYRAPAFFSAGLGLLNFILVLFSLSIHEKVAASQGILLSNQ